MTNESGSQRELPRVLGLKDVIGIIAGSVIGSGIFIVPAAMAVQVQSPLLLLGVWVAGGVLSLFGAMTFAELGGMYQQAGGLYVYLREAYGPLISFLFGWTLFLVIECGSMATLAAAFSEIYLKEFCQLADWQTKLVAAGVIFSLTAVNYIGVKWGALLQNIMTLLKFGTIGLVVGVAFLAAPGGARHFVEPAAAGWSWDLVSRFGIALVACMWAYKGWEMATYSAGEIRNPQRNLCLGLLIGCTIIITLYLLANLAYLYVFPVDQIASSGRIASDVLKAGLGPAGATVISLLILFSIYGAANGNVLTSPRVYFAMARDGMFFRSLAEIHPRFLTPHRAILLTGCWSTVLVLTGRFEQLFSYVVFGQWIFFGLTAAAVFILRTKQPGRPRPFKTWCYPVTPALFILAALFIGISSLISQPWHAAGGLVIIALGIPAYLYWHRRPA